MKRMLKGFMKGIAVGMVPGIAVGVMISCYMRQNRRGLKRHVGRTLRSAGDLVDNVLGMF